VIIGAGCGGGVGLCEQAANAAKAPKTMTGLAIFTGWTP
jgi:hypothetical protein